MYIYIWSTEYKARIKRLRKTQENILSGYRESTLVFKSKTKKSSTWKYYDYVNLTNAFCLTNILLKKYRTLIKSYLDLVLNFSGY